MCTTSEERKERNRQAQATHRERKNEYIKQLEATLNQQKEALKALQQSHRTASQQVEAMIKQESIMKSILGFEPNVSSEQMQVNSSPEVLWAQRSVPPNLALQPIRNIGTTLMKRVSRVKRGLSGFVNGSRKSAIADTCAAQNVVSAAYAKELKLQIYDSPSVIKLGILGKLSRLVRHASRFPCLIS